jgi:hypothetical protein
MILIYAIFPATLLALSLSLLEWQRPRPATLLIQPSVQAFATAPRWSQVYLAVAFTFLASLTLANLRLTDRADLVITGPFLLLFLPLVGLHVAAAWRGLTVQLRPDGVYQHDFAGSLTVPWEALAPGHPSRPAVRAGTLILTYVRPELVRRRGILVLGRRRLRIDNVHAWFIADAIRHYVDHPQHRAAIGEPAEYRRLWQALTYVPTSPDQGHSYWVRRQHLLGLNSVKQAVLAVARPST